MPRLEGAKSNAGSWIVGIVLLLAVAAALWFAFARNGIGEEDANEATPSMTGTEGSRPDAGDAADNGSTAGNTTDADNATSENSTDENTATDNTTDNATDGNTTENGTGENSTDENATTDNTADDAPADNAPGSGSASQTPPASAGD